MGAGDLVGGEGPVRPKDTFANLMTCLRVLAIVVVHLLAVAAYCRRPDPSASCGCRDWHRTSACQCRGSARSAVCQARADGELPDRSVAGRACRANGTAAGSSWTQRRRSSTSRVHRGAIAAVVGRKGSCDRRESLCIGKHRYRAPGTNHDGASVAVKIVRRGVADRLRRDTQCARWIIGFVARAKFLKGIPVVATFDQLARIIRSQADMLSEARTLARFRDGFSGERGPRVPKVYDEYTTRDLLVMELIEGASLFSDRLDERDFREVARQILAALYHMIFVDGLVHCDVHPGNLLVDVAQKRAILLDGGLAAELTEADRVCFRDLFFGLASCDSAACARAIVSSALVVPTD